MLSLVIEGKNKFIGLLSINETKHILHFWKRLTLLYNVVQNKLNTF